MKIKLPSLPFWARSPQYRRTINRRLTARTWTAPIKRDAQLCAERQYLRNDFTPGPCYLPPDAEIPKSPGPWRWWVDPIVIGMGVAFLAIGFGLCHLGGF